MQRDGLRAAVAALAADGLAEERWFGAKGIELGTLEPAGMLGPFGEDWLLAVRLAGHTYLLPAALADGELVEPRGSLWQALAQFCLTGTGLRGDAMELHGRRGPAAPVETGAAVRPLGVDQSNTSVVLGERLVLKCYRRLTPGEHPEIELTRYLTERGFPHLPAVRGSATLRVGDETGGALLLQDYVADGRDGWLAAEAELGSLLEGGDAAAAASAPAGWAAATGAATAELHALLASAEGETLAPRLAGPEEVDALEAQAVAELDEALAVVPEPARTRLVAAAPELRRRFGAFASAEPFLLTRVHGDLHLGQFLRRPDAPPMLVDFEGEPTKSAAERSRRASPLRDLASLLRSVDHAAHWVCSDRGEEAGAVAEAWIGSARRAIRESYDRRLAELRAPFEVDDALLAAFEAEKAAYEFVYAVRFLPSWLEVPTRALESAVA